MRIHAFIFIVFVIAQTSCASLSQSAEFSGFQKFVSNTLPVSFAWSYESVEPVRVPPRANHEVMVLLQTDGVFVALDIETGTVRWEYDTGRKIGWPFSDKPYDLNSEILITVTSSKFLTAIDAFTGRELWRIELNSISSVVPDVLLVDSVVVISSTSVEPTTRGYIAGYDLNTRALIFEKYYPSRSLGHSFRCPDFYPQPQSAEYTVCVSYYKHLDVIDFNPQLKSGAVRVQGQMAWEFATLDRPYFSDGYIFSVNSPDPAIQVIDVEQSDQFALPVGCETKKYHTQFKVMGKYYWFQPAAMRFTPLPLIRLETPSWVFHSTDELRTPFVTLHGDVGYILSNQAEIIGVDLNTGTVVGRFTTYPTSLNEGRYLHSLASQDSYLYAFLNGRQIFVFEQD